MPSSARLTPTCCRQPAGRGVLDHLAGVSRDFAASLKEDPTTADLRVRVFPAGHGPFGRTGTLKNVYLVRTCDADH